MPAADVRSCFDMLVNLNLNQTLSLTDNKRGKQIVKFNKQRSMIIDINKER